jgi:biopolymer transport protein TolR
MAFDVDTGKGGKKGRSRPEMNVTPLVDVVLVLLIIFMVAMPAMHRLFLVNVPAKETDAAPPAEGRDPIVVTVNERGAIQINRDVVSDAAFPARLRRMLVASHDRKIYFDAADGAPFERAVYAMDRARGAGAAHVAVMTNRLR